MEAAPGEVRYQVPFDSAEGGPRLGHLAGQCAAEPAGGLQLLQILADLVGVAGVLAEVDDPLSPLPAESQLEVRPPCAAVFGRDEPLTAEAIEVRRGQRQPRQSGQCYGAVLHRQHGSAGP